jgi:hypothetical protein
MNREELAENLKVTLLVAAALLAGVVIMAVMAAQ